MIYCAKHLEVLYMNDLTIHCEKCGFEIYVGSTGYVITWSISTEIICWKCKHKQIIVR